MCERDDDNILQMRRRRKKKLFIVTKYERMNHRIFEAKNRRAVLLGKREEFLFRDRICLFMSQSRDDHDFLNILGAYLLICLFKYEIEKEEKNHVTQKCWQLSTLRLVDHQIR